MLAAAAMGPPTPADPRARRWAGEGRTCPPASQQERQGGQRTALHPVPADPRARRWAGEGRTCPPASQQERQGGQRTAPHPVPRQPRCDQGAPLRCLAPAVVSSKSCCPASAVPSRPSGRPCLGLTTALLPGLQTQLREPRSLTLCTPHSSHCLLALLRVFLGASDAKWLVCKSVCVRVHARVQV